MKRLLFSILLFMVTLSSYASSSIVPYQKKPGSTKWGYRDSITLEEIYPCKLSEVSPMVDGIAPVNMKKRWGLLNSKGEFVLAPTYSTMKPAADGRYRVSIIGKPSPLLGYISAKTGEVIIPVKYIKIDDFKSNGMAMVEIASKSGYRKCGYVDWSSGKEIVAPQYTFLGDFGDGDRTWANSLGALRDGSTVHRGYHSIIDREGWGMSTNKFFIIFSPEEARELSSTVKSDADDAPDIYMSPRDIFDLKKEFVSKYYRKVGSLLPKDVNGYYFATTSYNNKAGVITKDGEIVVPDNRYDGVSVPIDGVSLVYKLFNGKDKKLYRKFYLYDTQTKKERAIRGNDLMGFQEGVLVMSEFYNATAGARVDSKTLLYNLKGKQIGTDYSGLRGVHNGIAVVCRDEKWGAINMKGEEIIPFGKYKYLGKYDENNKILVRDYVTDGIGYIDIDENVIHPLDLTAGTWFKNGMATLGRGQDDQHRKGVVDLNFKTIIPFEWSSILLPIYEGATRVWVEDGKDRWRLYDIESQGAALFVWFDSVVKQYTDKISMVKRGEKLALVSNETGGYIVPLTKCSEKELLVIYNYYLQRGQSEVSNMDVMRYFIRKVNSESDYKINQKLDKTYWDF